MTPRSACESEINTQPGSCLAGPIQVRRLGPGAFERGLWPGRANEMGIAQQLSGCGRAVTTASSAMEYAVEGGELADPEVAPSVFTVALVEGLETGEADGNQAAVWSPGGP